MHVRSLLASTLAPMLAALLLAGCAMLPTVESSAGPTPVDGSTGPGSSTAPEGPAAPEDPGEPEGPAGTAGLEPGLSVPGLPGGSGDVGPGGEVFGAAWTSEPGLVYVVLLGSGTCPVVPDGHAAWSGEVRLEISEPEGTRPCTRDLVPVTTVVALPPEADPSREVVLTAEGFGSVRLPAFDAAAAGEVVWGGR